MTDHPFRVKYVRPGTIVNLSAEQVPSAQRFVPQTEQGVEVVKPLDSMSGNRGRYLLLPSPPGDASGGFPTGIVGRSRVGNRQPVPLLDTNLDSYGRDMIGLGSFIFSLSSRMAPFPGALPSPVVWVPAMVAKVEFAAGGITHYFECDPNQSLALPADWVRMSIEWDELNAAVNTVGGVPWRVPSMEVFGTVVRSGQPSSNRVTRTRWCFMGIDATSVNIPVPPFARSFRIWMNNPTALSADDWTLQVNGPSGSQIAQDTMQTVQLARYARELCVRPVQWNAGSITVQRSGTLQSQHNFQIEFQLAFGTGSC